MQRCISVEAEKVLRLIPDSLILNYTSKEALLDLVPEDLREMIDLRLHYIDDELLKRANSVDELIRLYSEPKPLPDIPYYKIPQAIATGFSNHDCEAHYECPICAGPIASWSVSSPKGFNCPHCTCFIRLD